LRYQNEGGGRELVRGDQTIVKKEKEQMVAAGWYNIQKRDCWGDKDHEPLQCPEGGRWEGFLTRNTPSCREKEGRPKRRKQKGIDKSNEKKKVEGGKNEGNIIRESFMMAYMSKRDSDTMETVNLVVIGRRICCARAGKGGGGGESRRQKVYNDEN